jgi:hypothetical protein
MADGRSTPSAFLRMGSALVIAAPCFLAAGIAAETFVVLHKVLGTAGWAFISALASFAALTGLWYAIPAWLRIRLKRQRREDLKV